MKRGAGVVDLIGMRNGEGNKGQRNALTPTMENYLEAIFNLARENGVVRVRDIAKKLGVKMPAVTNMVKILGKRGLIKYEKYEYIKLTGKGSDVGSDIDQRHQILRKFLTDVLKMDFDQADEDAHKIGHTISVPTLERFVDFMVFVGDGSRVRAGWLQCFDEYRKHRQPTEIAKCLERMKPVLGE
jgi:DtxR family Mn-dependent transcriptional regulator